MLHRQARVPHALRLPVAYRGLSSSCVRRQAVASPPPPPQASLIPFSSRTEAPTDDTVPATDPRVAKRQTEFLISNLPGRVASAQADARKAAVIAENRAAAASYEGALAHLLLVNKACTAEDYCNPWRWAHQTYPDAVPRPPPAYEPSPAELAHAARVASSRFAATSSEEEEDEAVAGLEASSSSSDEEEELKSGMLGGFLKAALPEVEALERDMRSLVDATQVREEGGSAGTVSAALLDPPHFPTLPPHQPTDILPQLHAEGTAENDAAGAARDRAPASAASGTAMAASKAAAASTVAAAAAPLPPALVGGGLLPGVHFEGAQASPVRRMMGGRGGAAEAPFYAPTNPPYFSPPQPPHRQWSGVAAVAAPRPRARAHRARPPGPLRSAGRVAGGTPAGCSGSRSAPR